jgi:hypothetical protein
MLQWVLLILNNPQHGGMPLWYHLLTLTPCFNQEKTITASVTSYIWLRYVQKINAQCNGKKSYPGIYNKYKRKQNALSDALDTLASKIQNERVYQQDIRSIPHRQSYTYLEVLVQLEPACPTGHYGKRASHTILCLTWSNYPEYKNTTIISVKWKSFVLRYCAPIILVKKRNRLSRIMTTVHPKLFKIFLYKQVSESGALHTEQVQY